MRIRELARPQRSAAALSRATPRVSRGGGIYTYTDGVGGGTAIENSTISGNYSAVHGGGISSRVRDGGTTTISGSTLSGNSANTYGGGIYSRNQDGATLISGSTLSGNSAGVDGGGIYSMNFFDGETLISDSTLSAIPRASTAAASIPKYSLFGETLISNSTLSGNSAGVGGGGIYSLTLGGATLISDSTLSGNSAGFHGGGIKNPPPHRSDDHAQRQQYNGQLRGRRRRRHLFAQLRHGDAQRQHPQAKFRGRRRRRHQFTQLRHGRRSATAPSRATLRATAAASGRIQALLISQRLKTTPFWVTPPLTTAAASIPTTTARRRSAAAPSRATRGRWRWRHLFTQLGRHDDYRQYDFPQLRGRRVIGWRRDFCIYRHGAVTTMVNSTLSGNTVGDDGGGAYVINKGTTIITSTTITANRAGLNTGGGLYVDSSSTVVTLVRNSIVAANMDGSAMGTTNDIGGTDLASDLRVDESLVGIDPGVTGAGNLTGSPGTPPSPLNPKLGPLQNNGGSTQTHALLPSARQSMREALFCCLTIC